ncbi:MAG: hypothetical protein R3F14_04730 [Polyangiaceae bacterium]
MDEAVAADVVEELCAARRPMVILGTGARPHAAAIRDLVEALGVPFMTTRRPGDQRTLPLPAAVSPPPAGPAATAETAPT